MQCTWATPTDVVACADTHLLPIDTVAKSLQRPTVVPTLVAIQAINHRLQKARQVSERFTSLQRAQVRVTNL